MPLPYESSVKPDTVGTGPTTQRDIAALSCRIVAVYLLTQAVLGVSGGHIATLAGVGEMLFSGRFDPGVIVGAVAYIVPAIGMAVAGWLLWAKSRWLAARMISDDAVFNGLGQVTATDLLSIALSISGVFIFIDSIRHLVRNLALISTERPLTYWQSNGAWNQLNWTSGVEIILSLWLIFGSRGIAAIIRKMRSHHVPSETDHPTQE